MGNSLEFEAGAALADTYATALLGLQRRAALQKGDTVMVTAAAGGLGLAAVDLAANVFKCQVSARRPAAEAPLVAERGWSRAGRVGTGQGAATSWVLAAPHRHIAAGRDPQMTSARRRGWGAGAGAQGRGR